MRRTTMSLVAVAALAVAAVAGAQPEDRRSVPTGASATDPCANLTGGRVAGPQGVSPGYDPRVPMPSGATSMTGVAPPGRDPLRTELPAPASTAEQAHQDCLRRTGR